MGVLRPMWQVKQVTLRAPPNVLLLIVVTISIIRRAMIFWFFVSSSRFAASSSWQYGQPTPREASKNTIVGFNCSAGRPLKALMFLKTSSILASLPAAAPWAATGFWPRPMVREMPRITAVLAHADHFGIRFIV